MKLLRLTTIAQSSAATLLGATAYGQFTQGPVDQGISLQEQMGVCFQSFSRVLRTV